MSGTDADVFPPHWLSTSPVGSVTFDQGSARLEDVFDAWAFAADDARLALDAWAASPSDLRAEVHAVYRAALDREERAAAVLAAASA
jgi:hypothetical protein